MSSVLDAAPNAARLTNNRIIRDVRIWSPVRKIGGETMTDSLGIRQLHRGAVSGVWTFRTAERCWEISQGYAFFAYPWNTSALWNPHPGRVSRIPRTPCRGAILGASQYQGYAKN